jgi:ribosomal protein S18 acetylase RimI-like enzyme
MEIVPFTDEHAAAAAALLADRHARSRMVEPALNADPLVAAAAVAALLARAGGSGAVALRAGTAIGLLFGTPREDPTWGPNVWVEAAGQAVEEAELIRDLYAAAAERWVEEGRTHHYAIVPADDAALVDAWFNLGFGLQHVHAIGVLPERGGTAPVPAGVTVRRAVHADIPALARIEALLPDHHRRSPVFAAGRQVTLEERVAAFEEDFDDERTTELVAEVDGRVVGSATVCSLELSRENSGLVALDGAAFLAFAAVEPEWRGRGVGTALYEARLAIARESGYRVLATDYRAANLLSSRFFRRRGFRPTFLRLFRNTSAA